jgi:hypothetical protein
MLGYWKAELGFRVILSESLFDTFRLYPSNGAILLANL